jgi:hypothetical protein
MNRIILFFLLGLHEGESSFHTHKRTNKQKQKQKTKKKKKERKKEERKTITSAE